MYGGSHSASFVIGEAGRGGLQGQGRARGRAVQAGRPTGRADHGVDVLDLALHRVGLRVAAGAAAPAVVVEDRELPGQDLGQGRIRGSIDRAAGDEDDGRAVTEPVERDRRAVLGGHVVHGCLLGCRHRAPLT